MKRTNAAGFAPGNLFTDGDPLGGVPATEVEETWLNNLQEEVANVVEGAGITLNEADMTQLKQAINSMINAKSSNYKDAIILTTNTVLTAADAGKYYSIGANNITVTLPDPATLTNGMKFKITNPSFTGCSVATPTGDVLNILTAGTFTSTTLLPKSEYELVRVSGTRYHSFENVQTVSLLSNGHMIFSNGVIFQWGNSTTNGSGTVTVVWPIAFPNSLFNVQVADIAAGANPTSLNCIGVDVAANLTNSIFWGIIPSTGAVQTTPFYWFAIGA